MRDFWIYLSLVVAVLGMPDMAVLRANHDARMQATTKQLQAMHNEVETSLATFKSFPLQTTTDDEYYCNTSMWTFWLVWTKDNCSVVGDIWNETTTDDRLNEIANTYCAAKDANGYTCEQKVNWAFQQYATNCSKAPNIVDKPKLEQQRTLLTLSSIACLKDDTDQHSCLTDFRALKGIGENITLAKLQVGCVPCNYKVLNALDNYAPKTFRQLTAWLNLLCFKLKGDFCALIFTQALALEGAKATEDTMKVWCHPCTSGFVARHLTSVAVWGGPTVDIEQETRFLKLIRVMCITNHQGDHCFPLLTNDKANETFVKLGYACLPDLQKKSCSAACHEQIQNAKNVFGCCFGTWFNMLDWQYAAERQKYTLPTDPTTIRNFIKNECQSTISIGCAKEKVVVAIVLKNIAWAWYMDHKAEVERDLHAYLMWLLSLDDTSVGNVTVSQVTGGKVVDPSATHSKYQLLADDSTNGLSFTTTVYPATDEQVDAVTAAVEGSKDTPNCVANGWDLQARNNQQDGISSASVSATAVEDKNASPINTPAYSLAVFMAAIVALLLL